MQAYCSYMAQTTPSPYTSQASDDSSPTTSNLLTFNCDSTMHTAISKSNSHFPQKKNQAIQYAQTRHDEKFVN